MSTEQKLMDIKEEIIKQVSMCSSCQFTTSNIISDTFSCRGSQGEFEDTVVYRANITLQVPTSITDADDIVTYISQWVEDESPVVVKGNTLDLDADCPTILDSFASDDCVIVEESSNQTNPSPSSSSSSSSPFDIIIGAAVAAVVVIVLIIVIIIIVVYRRRKSTYRYCKVIKCAYTMMRLTMLLNRCIYM